ncbi:MAG: hypothetical protein K6D59_10370 [Bacteroidales bacterium]|nr:hypothetical protein [Bacteroidales bacterium]
MPLYIFNPEHDLCLANGDRNFVPPASALDFARTGMDVMRIIYGDEAHVIVADDYALWHGMNPDVVVDGIVPWGWDLRLKQTLLKQGVDNALLPDDRILANLRALQHRSTVLPLQPHATQAASLDEVRSILKENTRIVAKAPWSGAGRGVRWIDGGLSDHDEQWLSRVINTQDSVIVERRLDVVYDFAIEYRVENGNLVQLGYSLFKTQSGVYRYNVLLFDEEIKRTVRMSDEMEEFISRWLAENIAPFYNGVVGVDMLHCSDGLNNVSEINLRHTMGLVAHEFLRQHPDSHGRQFTGKRSEF